MKRRIALLILVAAVLTFGAGVVLSNFGDGLQLKWWSVDGGGGVSQGEDFLVQGTAGQYDAGSLTGDDYRLDGGFWQSVETEPYPEKVYLPVVIR